MMKRILYITSFTPSNHGAGIGYSNQLINDLSKNCLIDIVYFDYKNKPEYIIPNKNVNVIKRVEINTWFKLKGLLSLPWLFPLFSCRFSWKVCSFLQKQVENKNYDYVYFDFSQTFAYVPFIKHKNKILMSHDVILQKYSRMKKYLKPWVRITEPMLLKHGNAIFTFSEKDCSMLKKEYGIDSRFTTFYLKDEVLNAKPSNIGNYFVMFGDWGREENYESIEWFLDNIYEQVRPNYLYKLIGKGLPDYIKNRIEEFSNIEYLGFVEDPYPIIANAIAEIVPLHKGAGVKVKCIEALASGCPIIGTKVAFEGISDFFSSFMKQVESSSDFVDLMNTWREDLESRLSFKEFFLKEYNKKAIINYILD